MEKQVTSKELSQIVKDNVEFVKKHYTPEAIEIIKKKVQKIIDDDAKVAL